MVPVPLSAEPGVGPAALPGGFWSPQALKINAHPSARTAIPSRMSFRKPEMAMGDLRDREYQNYVVREESVRALVQALATVPAGAVGAHAD